MNDPISWDPSLVKKFSSSNHYKLLNQLRNEVKKYPLNNKKKTTSIPSNSPILDNNNKSNLTHSHNSSLPISPNQTNESDRNKSSVSFNNAKNFSIYKQAANNKVNRHNESSFADQSKSIEDSSPQSFKDRLNQIDLK